jgi:hypothetical protein
MLNLNSVSGGIAVDLALSNNTLNMGISRIMLNAPKIIPKMEYKKKNASLRGSLLA